MLFTKFLIMLFDYTTYLSMFLSLYLNLNQFQKLVLSLLMNTAFQHLSVKQLRLKHSTF